MFNLFRCTDYLANYDYSKVAWSDGKESAYIDESTNEPKFVSVDPSEHMSLNIGINVGNSALLDEKLRAMKQIAFSAAQNGNNTLAVEAIINDNLQELKHKILEADEAEKAYQQQMENIKNQASMQAKQMDVEAKQIDHQYNLETIQAQGDIDMQQKYIDQETQLLVWDKRLEVDKNGNGYISDDEAMKDILANAKTQIANLQIKREEFVMKQKQMENQRKSAMNKIKTKA